MATTSKLPGAIDDLFSADLRDRLIDLRKDLHRHPELSFKEERTVGILEGEMARLEPAELKRVAGTGLVARIKGRNSAAPVVAIRGDIDALPIHEETGLDYASENDGVMHACGHDVHATWTIAAATLLTDQPPEGDVIVLFQPAEEIGRGASAVIETGALDGVRAIFGAHVDRRFDVGQVVAQEGPLAASSDTFQITLQGVGAHGARPHEARDPVVGLAAIINSLQTVVSRRLNPAHPGVVTVGTVNSGTAPNIIPGQATLSGTIRAIEADTRRLLVEEVSGIATSIARAYGLTAEIEIRDGTPPIVNPPETVAWARAAAKDILGPDANVPLGFVNMAGEDFAEYMQNIPGCFVRVGARRPGGEATPAHSPFFFAEESSIFVGAALLAETARKASAALAAS